MLPRQEGVVVLQLLDFLIGWVFGVTVIILRDPGSIARKRGLVMSGAVGCAKMEGRGTLILYYLD